MPRWEFYQDNVLEWRWRLVALEFLGRSSEGYRHLIDCERNAARLGWSGRVPPSSAVRDSWELYLDADEAWRWRRTATNGRIVGAAHRGFSTTEAAVRNAALFGYGRRQAVKSAGFQRCHQA